MKIIVKKIIYFYKKLVHSFMSHRLYIEKHKQSHHIYHSGGIMKKVVISSLLCATILQAGLTKNSLEIDGFQENWESTAQDLEMTSYQGERCVIHRNHVPMNALLPRNTQVYFPVPKREVLHDRNAINFETDGTYNYGHYCEPETNSKRIFWSIVEDGNGKRYTVPTARLMIALDKEVLTRLDFQENWHEDAQSQTIDTMNGQVTIHKNHVPLHGSLKQGTEVYFPTPAEEYLNNKSSVTFYTDGTYRHGYYYTPERNSERIFWSLIQDDKGNLYTVPTARLMLSKKTMGTLSRRSSLR